MNDETQPPPEHCAEKAAPLPWWANPRLRDQSSPLALVLIHPSYADKLRAAFPHATDPSNPELLFGLDVLPLHDRPYDECMLVIREEELPAFADALAAFPGELTRAYLVTQAPRLEEKFPS